LRAAILQSSSSKIRECRTNDEYPARLEGSRFGPYPATLASFVTLLIPLENAKKRAAPRNVSTLRSSKTGMGDLSECIIVGNSREPLFYRTFWRDWRCDEYCERGGMRAKAAPLQVFDRSTDDVCSPTDTTDD
jgi:hypothetical protein